MTRKVGRGPVSLAIVALAATPYLAACDQGPAPDTLSTAVVCADVVASPPVRVPDERCQDAGPAAHADRYDWASAQLGGTDDDDDHDGGGFFFASIGSPLGPGYSRGYPAYLPSSKIARGVSPRGGNLTRFGGGSAGAMSPGSRLSAPGNTQVRAGSTSVSRGGLGFSSGSSSSSGGKGGSGGSSGS